MIKKIVLSVLLLSISFSYAQESTSSPYSFYGLGIQKFRGTIANVSMGGITTYSDPVTANIQNPALYGDIDLTTFAVGGTYNSTSLKTNEGESNAKITSFDYLAISIPTKIFGFGLGIIPYRSLGYDVTTNSGNERTELTGEGNVSRVYLGVGAKIYKGLKIGAEFQYNFGRLKNETILFPQTDNNTREILQSDISGVSYTISAVYDANINEEKLFRASVIYSISGDLKSENTRQLAGIAQGSNGRTATAQRLIEVPTKQFQVPSRYTFGVGLLHKSKWYLGSEFFVQENNDYQDRFRERPGVLYTDAFGVKMGGYFVPKFNSLTNYLERMTYRAGIRYETLGLSLEGTEINEFGISFGVSLPMAQGYSTLDLGAELGSRGTTAGGWTKENFINFSVGLSLSDKWFKKRKFN